MTFFRLLAVVLFTAFLAPIQQAGAATDLTTDPLINAPAGTPVGAPAGTPAATVTIDDRANILSFMEEATLKADTARVELPASVTRVVYLTFATNDENLNDTVRYYTADHDMHSPDGQKYADGLLISAVGMDPHKMGVYCGDDVCRDLEIYDANDSTDRLRINAITDEMRPLLQDEKWEEGLLRGIEASADTSVRDEPYINPRDEAIFSTLDKFFGFMSRISRFEPLLFIGAAIFMMWKTMRTIAGPARKNYDYIIDHHGDIANRLREIDIRAHSLSSSLADDALRSQWRDIRDKFLAAHETMGSLDGISHSSSTLEFYKKAAQLRKARRAVENMVNAEANIEKLAGMEHGDTSVRRKELTDLHEDALEAIAKANPPLSGQLEQLNNRILRLRDDVETPYFMDTFADILGDYKVLIEELEKQEFKRRRAKKTTTTLSSADWRPGVGSYYVPFGIMSTWYASNDRSWHFSNSSDSFSSGGGYSSSGFSGGGGSSSF